MGNPNSGTYLTKQELQAAKLLDHAGSLHPMYLELRLKVAAPIFGNQRGHQNLFGGCRLASKARGRVRGKLALAGSLRVADIHNLFHPYSPSLQSGRRGKVL